MCVQACTVAATRVSQILRNKHGDTPLLVACQKGHTAIASLLVNAVGVKLNAKNKFTGNTALHYAMLAGNPSLVKLLLTCGMDAGIQNSTGKSPQKIARERRNKALQILVDEHGPFEETPYVAEHAVQVQLQPLPEPLPQPEMEQVEAQLARMQLEQREAARLEPGDAVQQQQQQLQLQLLEAEMSRLKLEALQSEQRLHAHMERLQRQDECCVCFGDQLNSVIIPCGHICCCFACAVPLQRCPICRRDIERVIQTFKS